MKMPHKHSVHDGDLSFLIDPISRQIINNSPKKIMLIQHDHNSERITFELPRYVEGHDMSACNMVEVHYINIDATADLQNKGVYQVTDLQVDQEDTNKVTCSWLISRNATGLIGSLNFLVRFTCVDADVVKYAWNTAIYSDITISSGIYNSEAIVEKYADVLARWKNDLYSITFTNIRVDGSTLVVDNSERSTLREELEKGTLVVDRARVADTVYRATEADHALTANTATLADNANYAGSAGTARYADETGLAYEATHAINADLAEKARTALTADLAENAKYAQNASSLDGNTAKSFMGNGTQFEYINKAGADCNTLYQEGHYFIFNGSNHPKDTVGWGFLDVSHFGGNGFEPNGDGKEAMAVRQVFTEYPSGKVYTRIGLKYERERWNWEREWICTSDGGQAVHADHADFSGKAQKLNFEGIGNGTDYGVYKPVLTDVNGDYMIDGGLVSLIVKTPFDTVNVVVDLCMDNIVVHLGRIRNYIVSGGETVIRALDRHLRFVWLDVAEPVIKFRIQVEEEDEGFVDEHEQYEFYYKMLSTERTHRAKIETEV